jgi:hypothetical protein
LRWIAIATIVDNGLVDDNPTVVVDSVLAGVQMVSKAISNLNNL